MFGFKKKEKKPKCKHHYCKVTHERHPCGSIKTHILTCCYCGAQKKWDDSNYGTW